MTRGIAGLLTLSLAAVLCAGCGSSQPSTATSGGGSGGPSLYDKIEQARQEPNAESRARKLIVLADQQRRALDRTGANTTFSHAADAAKEVTDPVAKVGVLSFLAKGYARAENKSAAERAAKEAAQVAGTIEAPETKATALTTVASALAAAGDKSGATTALGEAEKLADSLQDPEGRTIVLCDITEVFHQIEYQVDFERLNTKALETAEGIEDLRKRSDAIAAVAEMQKRIELPQADQTFELALATARQVEDPTSQAFALTDIADKLLAVKQRDKALAVLQEAEKLADKLQSGSLKTELMDKIYKLRG